MTISLTQSVSKFETMLTFDSGDSVPIEFGTPNIKQFGLKDTVSVQIKVLPNFDGGIYEPFTAYFTFQNDVPVRQTKDLIEALQDYAENSDRDLALTDLTGAKAVANITTSIRDNIDGSQSKFKNVEVILFTDIQERPAVPDASPFLANVHELSDDEEDLFDEEDD